MNYKNPFQSMSTIQLDFPDISKSTIRNILSKNGIKDYKSARKPLLTNIHKENRLRFATYYLEWTREDWRRIYSSNES